MGNQNQPETDNYYGASTCRIEVSCHRRAPSEQPVTYFSDVDSQQEVIAMDFHKMSGDPCGAFSLTLKPLTQDWLKVLRPNDWIDIYVRNGREGREEHLCSGLIDTVTRPRQAADPTGATDTTIQVTGRDMGKALLETDPFVDSRLLRTVEGLLPYNGARDALKNFAGFHSAGELLDKLMSVYFDLNNQASFQFSKPDGTPIYKIDGSGALQLSLHDDDPGLQTLIGTIPTMQQSVWQILQSYSNTLINHLYVEMLPDQRSPDNSTAKLRPTLCLHRLPYGVDDFAAMEGITVYKNETKSDSLTLASHEVRNFFRVDSTIFVGGQSTNIAATTGAGYLNQESIRRHGIKRMDVESLFAQSNDKSSIIDNLQTMMRYLVTWYWNMEELLCGQLQMRLRPDLRLGKRLDFQDEDGEYSFIMEGYSHSWRYEGPSFSTAMLSRGVPSFRRAATLKKFEELTSGATPTISNIQIFKGQQ